MKCGKSYWRSLMKRKMVSEFIKSTLILNEKLISKRCRLQWFENTDNMEMYDALVELTSFLPITSEIVRRIWHVYNDVYEIPICKYDGKSQVNFKSFKDGYYQYSIVSYVGKSSEIKQKIQNTNFEKYGVSSYTQTEGFKEKAKRSWIEKYGVDNPSKSKEVIQKKVQTCRDNYGVMWPQQSKNVRDKSVITNLQRYGEVNPMKSDNVRKRTSETRLGVEYDRFFNNPLFSEKMTPLFTVSEYVGIDVEYPFMCKRCNMEFTDILRGGKIPRCYNCYPNANVSVAETELADYIEFTLGVPINRNDKTVLVGKEIDIYIPSMKIGIEFNGLYYHSELSGGKGMYYHLNKTDKCAELGIRLIHIFEDEWLDMKDIVKNRLKILLGKVDKKIYARNCVVSEIEPNEASEFINKTHIQQNVPSMVKLGLFNGGELVGVMTFSKRKIFKADSGWELVRFSTSDLVVGGFGKLLRYFEVNYNPKSIVSYALRRWLSLESNVYIKTGFILETVGYPGFFYTKSGHRYNRIGFQKHKLKDKLKQFDMNLTEWQNMQLNGYDRIWDCGSAKYIKNY
jgi:hypothetical protein